MPKSTRKPKNIYMDYASTTPVETEVFSRMAKISKENFSNPSAIYELGMKAKKILEDARKEVALILNAHKDEIIFTSGATESNNLAILGTLKKAITHKGLPHIVTTNIEHASVLEVCRYLEKTKQADVTYVPVEPNGIVDPKKIKKAIKRNTVLVSVMYANNEIGTIQPISEIAKEIRHYKKTILGKDSPSPIFHTDATQAVNYLPINVLKLGVDLLSLNAAKIYGPKGVGVLYVKKYTAINKIIFGGNQEFDLRPGTENIVSVVGLAEALKLTEKIKQKEIKRLIVLRDYFFKKLNNLNSGLMINGDLKNRLPNNVNITVSKIPSDLLVIELSARGVMASAKSACKSGDGKASHVIEAINPKAKDIDGSLRFSLGRQTTKKDIDYASGELFKILTKYKKWYN